MHLSFITRPWALSNKLCIWSVVRVICEVSFRIPQGAERSKCEKPDDRLIWLQKWLICHFFFLTPMKRDTTLATADLRLHSYQDSSEDASSCQREKPKIVHTTNKDSMKSRFRVHLPRYKWSDRRLFNPLFLTLESILQLIWCLHFQIETFVIVNLIKSIHILGSIKF